MSHLKVVPGILDVVILLSTKTQS